MTPIEYLQEMRMPEASLAFMVISAAIAILLPAALFIYFKVKYNSKLVPTLVGMGIFVLFALVLEVLFINVLPLDSLTGIYPTPASNLAIYTAIICLCSGIFQETGRFAAFKWILRKDNERVNTPLAYGVGHGGIEAIAVIGVSTISMIVTGIMINNGQIISELSKGTNDQILEVIDLAQTDSNIFLATGVERISVIALHICLSVLIWLAVRNKKLWLYPIAIVLHALANVSVVLYQLDILENIWIAEAILAACVLLIVGIARLTYVKLEKSLESVRIYSEEENT